MRGWVVAAVLVDNDVSAFSGRRRPAYEDLLDRLRGGGVGAVVVWHPDRLHRSPRELEVFIDLVEASGVAVATVRAGAYDLTTATGRMTARIVGATARYESELKSERARRKSLESAQLGVTTTGGCRPFGFEADRVTVRESEAVLVRESAARVLAGESLRSVCRDWVGRGVVSAAGKAWRPTGLRRMLVSGRVAGLREHRGVVVGDAEWEALISTADWRRLTSLFADRRDGLVVPRRYVLSGLLRCGRCGAVLSSRPRGDGVRRYVCAKSVGSVGCNGCAIVAAPVEELVIEAVLLRLESGELLRALTSPVGVAVLDTAREIDGDLWRLDELATAYGEGSFSLSEWLAARKPIEARLEAHRKAVKSSVRSSALDGFVGETGRLRGLWSELSIERRHAVLRAVLDHAVIGRGRPGSRVFDPARVVPVWAC